MSWAASEAARRPPHSASSCPGARAPAHRHAHTLLAALPHEAPRKGPASCGLEHCPTSRASASARAPRHIAAPGKRDRRMACNVRRPPRACRLHAQCAQKGAPAPGCHALRSTGPQQGGPVPGARGAHHARAAVRGGRQRTQRACAQRPRWWRAAASRMRASTPPRQAATAPPAGSRPSRPPVAGSGRGQGRSHGSELAAQLSAGMGYPLARQCTPVPAGPLQVR